MHQCHANRLTPRAQDVRKCGYASPLAYPHLYRSILSYNHILTSSPLLRTIYFVLLAAQHWFLTSRTHWLSPLYHFRSFTCYPHGFRNSTPRSFMLVIMTRKIPTLPPHPPAHPVFKTPPLPSPPRSHYSLPRLPSNSSAHFLSTMAHNLERWDSAELWDAVDGPDLSALAQLSQSILEPSSDRMYSAVSS